MPEESLTSIKVFLPEKEKQEYHKLCFDRGVKMSADIRKYIVQALSGETKEDIVDDILGLFRAQSRPKNSDIVKLARKLGIETEELMAICDRLFNEKGKECCR